MLSELEKKFETQKEFAQYLNVSYAILNSWICFREVPTERYMTNRPDVIEKMNLLVEEELSWEIIFPILLREQVNEKLIKRHQESIKEVPILSLSCHDEARLIDYSFNDIDLEIDRTYVVREALQYLTVKEEDIVRKYYGIGCDEHTLEEIGKIYNVGRGRPGQIIMKALRKLKHPTSSKKLRIIADIKGDGYD